MVAGKYEIVLTPYIVSKSLCFLWSVKLECVKMFQKIFRKINEVKDEVELMKIKYKERKRNAPKLCNDFGANLKFSG